MKKAFGLLFLLLLVAAGAAAFMYWRINEPYRGYQGAEQFVELPQGTGSLSIGDRLVAAGVIRDRAVYRVALWWNGQGRHLQAGDYRFDRAMTPFEVIDKIARGDVYVVNVTFPEGLTIVETAKIFESHGIGDAAAFADAARNAGLVRGIDPSAADLEGYLFPETYAVSRH